MGDGKIQDTRYKIQDTESGALSCILYPPSSLGVYLVSRHSAFDRINLPHYTTKSVFFQRFYRENIHEIVKIYSHVCRLTF